MFINYNSNPKDTKNYDTKRLRDEFLISNFFSSNKNISIVYSHIDRIVAIGIELKEHPLSLDKYINNKSFGTEYFLERRELGILNLEDSIEVRTKNNSYHLDKYDILYLGKGEQNIEILSLDSNSKSSVYCLSAPAHHRYPSRVIKSSEAKQIALGSKDNANERVIFQYLHPDVLPTCQLCMGITHLKKGSVWNTMPPHTHARRMEAYLYFNIKKSDLVFHFMGEPEETRHIVVRDKELVLSPSWSIHSGCGTSNYSFVWGMLGENQTFNDMDFIDINYIK